MDLEMNYVPSN